MPRLRPLAVVCLLPWLGTQVGCNCGGTDAVAETDGAGGSSGAVAGSATEPGTMETSGAATDGETEGQTGALPPEHCGFTFEAAPAALWLGYVADAEYEDLDGDGHRDLIVTRAAPENPQAISVLLGQPDGSFADPVDYDLPGTDVALHVADFDEDGALDILAVGYVSEAKLFRHAGDGALELVSTTSLGSSNCSDLAVADVDGDGHLDFAVACESQQTTTDDNEYITVRRGLGDGTFEYHFTAAMKEPRGVHLVDLDDDGLPELLGTAFAPTTQAEFFVFHNEGSEAETDAFVLDAVWPLRWGARIASGDFDDDGDPDVAVAQEWESDIGGAVKIFENDGGSLLDPSTLDLLGAPYTLAVADLDGDGQLDFAAAGTDGYAQVVLGQGDLTFVPGPAHPTGSGRYHVHAPDLDGDGAPDLLYGVARGLAMRVGPDEIFEELPALELGPPAVASEGITAVTAADFDDDGHLDLATAAWTRVQVHRGAGGGSFETVWQAELPAANVRGLVASDLDGDGVRDLAVATDDGALVHLGDGAGGFSSATQLVVGQITGMPTAGDLDGDGIDDLVVPRDGGIYGWLSATQTLLSESVDGIGVSSVAVADFDADGTLDAALAGSDLFVVFGDGQGGFTEEVRIEVDVGLSTIRAADLDGDGDPDVVSNGITAPHGAIFGGLAWFENQDGVLGLSQATPPTGMEVHGLAVADLDGDRAEDVISLENVGMAISVWAGPGLVYRSTHAVAGEGRPSAVADGTGVLGDFDGDGTLDLAVADFGRNRILVLRGHLRTGDACD